MNDFPLQITSRRWIYAVIERPGFRKLLDQDEFFYAYATLVFIKENPKTSNYAISQFLQEIQTRVFEGNYSKYRNFDVQAKMYSYLLANAGLITFEEHPDAHTGPQTRCLISITKKGKEWLEDKHELAENAKTLKETLRG